MSGTVPDLEGRDESEWAVHYRQKATHFKEMASGEAQPRVRAQLLGLAAEYDQLADSNPRQPSGKLRVPRGGNNPGIISVLWGEDGPSHLPEPSGPEGTVQVRRR
jgi:hypothetical protein